MPELTETESLAAPAAEPQENPVLGIDQTAGNFSYKMDYEFDAGTGLSEKTIRYISAVKKEAPMVSIFPHFTRCGVKSLPNSSFIVIS